MISKDDTKILLLKLLKSKSTIKLTEKSLGQVPDGVFREIIKYVQYWVMIRVAQLLIITCTYIN